MKKRWILALFILWSLAAGQLIKSYEQQKEHVAEVFSQVGVGEQTCVVEYYGVYKGELLNMEEREEFLRKIAEKLGIDEQVQIRCVYEEEKQETELKKEAGKATTTLRIITSQEEETVIQYMIMNITMQSGMKTALEYRERINTLMQPYGKYSRSSANVIASYPGEMTLPQRNALADGILKELGAEVISENRDMKLYTIYAYTPWLQDYEKVGNDTVNVNIAMYYSETKNKTFVYGAVPLAGLDY